MVSIPELEPQQLIGRTLKSQECSCTIKILEFPNNKKLPVHRQYHISIHSKTAKVLLTTPCYSHIEDEHWCIGCPPELDYDISINITYS